MLAIVKKRPNNQEIERYYFEQFRKHFALPLGDLVYTDKPDVVIHAPKTLGIEIANLYIEQSGPWSEQVQRQRRLKVIERAQALHRSTGGRNTELSADFNPRMPIEEIEPVASSIAALAREVADLPSGSLNPSRFTHIPQLRFVYHNAKEYADAKWRLVQGFSVPMLSIDRLRDIVAQKSEKAKSYQPCNEYWLLLVVDFMDAAQDQEIRWPEDMRLGKSAFEKVLLYKPQFAEVVVVPK
jgi:hypothetical protein